MKEIMTDAQYAQADEELFAMLGGKKPTGRKTVGVFISEKRAKDLMYLELLYDQIENLIPVAGWTFATLVFLAATVFGWMEITFGSTVTVVSFFIAALRFWKLRHH